MKPSLHLILALSLISLPVSADHTKWVDPRIGSVGLGRVFIGPSMPYGMVKPGPDCVTMPNAGWAEMPEMVKGFTQTHVSGTGGGQKYGNILIQPFLEGDKIEAWNERVSIPLILQERKSEDIRLGYYSTTYTNGIKTEITSSERCAIYRITSPRELFLLVDTYSFLGMDTIPGKREAQEYCESKIESISKREICGWTRIRGGWNNGGPYTVYFCLQADRDFQPADIWDAGSLSVRPYHKHLDYDDCFRTIKFTGKGKVVNIKIGISNLSTQAARRNIVGRSLDLQHKHLLMAWEEKLKALDIVATEKQKRMFYTAIYHTMLMPVEREPGALVNADGRQIVRPEEPYYDDYYAIWDTYRTSMPLLTLIDTDRQRDMINSLVNIYKTDGYMPDARSGNWNGRTQGGSNANIVIADAMAKGLKGIDYRTAFEAMIKDAETPPADDEKEGRGGLHEYNTLGYIPYGIPRAGTRTVEYSYDDWCIAQVAKGLGIDSLYNKYLSRSHNWKNLWREDYEWQGMRGFIMPKDTAGNWLDSVRWGKSKVFAPKIPYRPDTKVAPWNLPWWNSFFYEALSAEYSLSMPHDVPQLIKLCGGEKMFIRRLDTFFKNGHYNVANEPSFLTPWLYHWAGHPEMSLDRIRQIINDNYDDTSDGLPGNDDSGAMSSWLVFNMLGIYPVAGQNLYLVRPDITHNGQIQKTNQHEQGLTAGTFMRHDDVVEYLRNQPLHIDTSLTGRDSNRTQTVSPTSMMHPENLPAPQYMVSYTLNRQYRTWPVSMVWNDDTLYLTCNASTFIIPRRVVEDGTMFSWSSPYKGKNKYVCDGTFLFISRNSLHELQESGSMIYDTITWRAIDTSDGIIHVKADTDGTEMWIDSNSSLPMVVKMMNNPLGIDWTMHRR